MERTLSQEERIRRAEEIYNSRRKQDYGSKYYKGRLNEGRNNDVRNMLMRKMVCQVLVCAIIYLTIYILQNTNMFFSGDVQRNINNFLSYDIEFANIYNNVVNYFNSDNSFIKKIFNNKGIITNTEINMANNLENNQENNATVNEANIVSNNQIINTENSNKEIENSAIENIVNQTSAIGGAEENSNDESKSQAELDIEYVKKNYNFIWPLNGVITSKFGTRTPTDIVTANHYGLDIGGNTGDSIVSAIDGTVTLVSTEGDYGKHIKIENGEVTTLYAHCSALCVEEGAKVSQGDKVAEVGQTGRATRSTFTF